MSVIQILLVILVIFFGLLYMASYKFCYWKKKKVCHKKPLLLFGNYRAYITGKHHMGIVLHNLCQQFRDAPFFGTYYGTEPALVVKDPGLLKLIMTKDFFYFNGREVSSYYNKEVGMQNVFFAAGDQWRVARKHMSPLFSSVKMKNMFYLTRKSAKKYEIFLENFVKNNEEGTDARFLAARFTMDSIGTAAFGIETRTLEETEEDNPFTVLGNHIFDNSFIGCMKLITHSIWPTIFYVAGLKVFPEFIGRFFNSLLRDVFKSRGYKPVGRNDFTDLLLKLKENGVLICDSISNFIDGSSKKLAVKVTDKFLISQSVAIFGGGYETSATTQAFVLYELAKNKQAQKHAQAEVDDFLKRHSNHLIYDCASEMTYLEACIDEALRLYPVLSVITREVMEDYTFPTGLKLEKGLRVHIPVWHIHRNPDYFPDPDQYKPERFLPGNKQNIKPFTYLPFGEGPRICIGKRFGKMQVIAGLMTVLKAYTVELTDDMPSTAELKPISLNTQPLHGLKLKFLPREGREDRRYH